MTILSNTKQ